MQTIILGYIATFLINIAYVPQVVKTIRTKNVEGLSLVMFAILILAGILWIIYGVLLDSLPLIICNSINVIQSCILLFYKLKYETINKRSSN